MAFAKNLENQADLISKSKSNCIAIMLQENEMFCKKKFQVDGKFYDLSGNVVDSRLSDLR
jgi:hypothetical protein